MKNSTLELILKITLVAAPAIALAEPVQEWRCSTDSLDPTAARQRIEWARKCGLTTNSGGTNSWFESSKAFDQDFKGAKDYKESNTSRSFTGNLNAYNVNFYHSYARYDTTPQYRVNKEALGATSGYWKWAHTVERPRPLYPSFEDTPVAGSGTQLYPHPNLTDCKLYTDKTGSTVAQWPNDHFVIAYCESSCYAPDQSLRFANGDVNIVEAVKAQRDDLVTLSPDATLENPATQTSRVYSYTSETRDGEHLLYTLTTASGGRLSVTNEHPVLTSEGRLVKAEQLREGDELLKADGTPDPIVKVDKSTHFGKVYNVKPMSREPVANILIAQGYLVGSARFQNDDVGYMNRVLLFRGVPDEAMPK